MRRSLNIRYVVGTDTYDGTIRITYSDPKDVLSPRTASGDLYLQPKAGFQLPSLNDIWTLFAGKKPEKPTSTNVIPVLPLAQYRSYLRVTGLTTGTMAAALGPGKAPVTNNPILLSFERWNYTHPTKKGEEGNWNKEKLDLTASLSKKSASQDSDILSGPVKDTAGAGAGEIQLFWVADFYRSINVDIWEQQGENMIVDEDNPVEDVPTTKLPGTNTTLVSVFQKAGIEVKLLPFKREHSFDMPSESWSVTHLNSLMAKRRSDLKPNTEDRFSVFVVENWEGTPPGGMFDFGDNDVNKTPREGSVVETDWKVPNKNWGTAVVGKKWRDLRGAVFWTVMHVLGHQMNLPHNSNTSSIMARSELIASSKSADKFPANIGYEFAADDVQRLRHWPDIYIRPGGYPFAGDGKSC